ncbi:hypothetical protein CLV86_1104 [Lacinutrix venerupis]|uniref:hypothetical protein n=1 Tax=Lacinutrix venerupis TaxID=1486034 RepID=UPI000EAC06AA|nr:hypothetical protein [Lacinutrix venerupis]RLJ65528.1 hypothetical protein CLV86_1104 [Lacinutrix venerupis]
MKLKSLALLLVFGVLLNSCNKDDDNNQNTNPYIPNAVFDTGNLINTSLPQYNQMQFPGNHIVLNSNYGIKGVVVYFSGSAYSAFELSDPNHAISSCSNLTVDGIIATCGCEDENAYEILNGTKQDGGQYAMVRYQVEVIGDVIRVYNN